MVPPAPAGSGTAPARDAAGRASQLSLECQRDVLLDAIQAADAVVPSNSTKPILTHLLLDAHADRLEIIATDLQVGLRSIVRRIQVISPGQAVVQARQLAAILKESHSPVVSLRLEPRGDGAVLSVQLSDGDYQVPVTIGEPFPEVTAFPAEVAVWSLRGKRAEAMLNRTAFAMDKDRASAVLAGMYLSIGHGEMILCATDGKVLCEAVEKDDSYVPAERIQVVLPAITVSHLQRIIAATVPDVVELAVAAKLVFFRLRQPSGLLVEITSRLVDGAFPAYRNALPPSGGNAVSFIPADLASAVRRAALMTNQTSRGLVLQLEPDRAVFTNLNYTNGSARIPVPCTYQGGPLRLGIDSKYLADVLRVYVGDRIGIELGRGLVMREPGATYLIMPISLPN